MNYIQKYRLKSHARKFYAQFTKNHAFLRTFVNFRNIPLYQIFHSSGIYESDIIVLIEGGFHGGFEISL